MKIAMFSTKEQYRDHLNSMADAIEANGLRRAQESLESAQTGKGKYEWLRFNNIPEDSYESAWMLHIEWIKAEVRDLKHKIAKLRRDAMNA